ncbi:DNA polymerase kappa isoform X3 [Parus major]|uniref:DNA polymerase kappa isoform X3 n=1 Tax=Parus major TaxID=9157 RepID=UPI0007712065|nr:DNA polymerase kappa isoform X3 [Parus major]
MDNMKKVANSSCNDGVLLRMGLNDNKAGMQGLDKEKINKIIMEATKGSKFYENELKKDQQVNQRIEKMMQLKEKITAQQLLKAQLQVDKLVIELEQSRNLNSTIVHIDMDAFYAAVEMRDNPELKDKPIAVGSMSMLVREVLAEYDPNFMPMGLDEAYLNITEHLEERLNWPEDRRRFFFNTESTTGICSMNMSTNFNQGEVSSSPVLFEDNTSPMDDNLQHRDLSVENSVVFGTSAEEVVKEIRFRIEQKTQLTASAGIAPNTMLAKMCSDRNKPNGQYRISPERLAVLDFLKDLPIRKVPGIGKVTEKMLKALGIVTCSELYQQRALLSLLFSEVSWRNFLDISLGLGSTHLEKDGERKSMSTERTFSEINTAEDQYSLCRELCRDLAQDLQKEGLKGRTVTLKLKNVNFEVKTRASTVLSSVSTEEEIFTVAKDLLGTEIDSVAPHPLRIRLMGVRVSGFLTEEEKKYQQKSITSFLKSGKEIGFLRLQPEKSNQDYFTKNSEAPFRGSFFDQKRAARKLNSENISPNESRGKQLFHDDKSSANLVEETKEVTNLQNSNVCNIFTCPVCFEKQSSKNLEELNKHIDECLNDEMCVEDAVEVFKNDSSRENIPNFVPQFKNEFVDKCQKNKTDQISGTDQSASVSDSSTNGGTEKFGQIIPDKSPGKQEPSSLSDIARNMCMKQCLFPKRVSQDRFDKTEHTEGTSSSCFFEAKEDSVLVCPVCNSEQKTTDLVSFNRHVDVCLNKGLIQELTEKDDFPTKTYNMENSNRVFSGGLSKGQQCTNPSQGTKRSGLTASESVSKKAKSSNSKHTIKMFFK